MTAATWDCTYAGRAVRYIVPRHSEPIGVLRMIALSGRTREVSKVEPPELLLRNGLLLLITLGQPVRHDGFEVDIWIHNVVRSTFRFRMRVPGA
jgi:hypothetical protein